MAHHKHLIILEYEKDRESVIWYKLSDYAVTIVNMECVLEINVKCEKQQKKVSTCNNGSWRYVDKECGTIGLGSWSKYQQ